MSPFDHKILDVRIASSSKVTLDMSAVEGDYSVSFYLSTIFFLSPFLVLQLFLLSNLSTLFSDMQNYLCTA